MAIDQDEITKRFTYHTPSPADVATMCEIRRRARTLARYIAENTPSSREQSLAMTKLEEASMWANAGLARNGQSQDE